MLHHGVEPEVGFDDGDVTLRHTTMGSRRGTGLRGCLNRRITRILLVLAALFALLYWHWRSSAFGTSIIVTQSPPRGALTTQGRQFWLDGRPIVILSGSVHYFRIVPEYWRDRLSRLKAAGLNTVSTYVPWNLHEEVRGEFDFSGILDLRRYIELADELGLHVILRPGPYICSEWDYGGLPSWLLHDPFMAVRTTYKPYMQAVDRYLARVAREVAHLQRHMGGPIIAIQVENEYGVYALDSQYMRATQKLFTKHGLTEFHFTSDNLDGLEAGSLPDAMMTINFNAVKDGAAMFTELDRKRPNSPRMVAEFWDGWFDTWGPPHHVTSVDEVTTTLEFIFKEESSVNFYMFHGGTNFGFMNGANLPLMPQTTSYDYDSPVSEGGDLTPKYFAIRDLIFTTFPEIKAQTPQVPPPITKIAYPNININRYMSFKDLLTYNEPKLLTNPVTMETLDINNIGGQAHGFIAYSHHSNIRGTTLEIQGNIRDRAQVLLDFQVVTVFDQDSPSFRYRQGNDAPLVGALTILVENLGRVNYATGGESSIMDDQRKGIKGRVLLDDKVLDYWYHYPLEFKLPLMKTLSTSDKWVEISVMNVHGPVLLRTHLVLTSEPRDSYIDMTDWGKGVVFVNGRNLGRYWSIGPQRTLYLPAPFLKVGRNEIIIFELHTPSAEIVFSSMPLWT